MSETLNKYIISLFFIVLLVLSSSKAKSDFLSLKSNTVNMRVGPGLDYPVKWVYLKKNMPLKLINNFENWRQVRDMNGEEGWIQVGLLSTNRYLVTKNITIGYSDNKKNFIKITIDPIVTLKFIKCEEDICKVSVQGYKVWVEKKNVWGD